MKVLRTSYSSYQNKTELAREAEELRNLGVEYELIQTPPEELNEPGAEVLLINSSFEVTEKMLDRCPEVELIITATSGYDQINLTACVRHEVRVARTPEARARRVSEHTLALILGLLRDFAETGLALKNGRWERELAAKNCVELQDREIGIIGFGEIGKRVAKLLSPLVKTKVRVSDPLKKTEIKNSDYFQYCRLPEMLKKCSIISLHTDLNPSTKSLINSNSLKLFQPGSYLINTARGEIVDQPALLTALKNDKLAGAGLDVYTPEPPSEEQLLASKKVLATPHAAGFGPNLLADLRKEIVETVRQYQQGEPLPNRVRHRTNQEQKLLNKENDGFR